MTFDGKAFGKDIVEAVKAHVADVLAPINHRLDAIERGLAAVPCPAVDEDDIEAVKSDVESIRVDVLAKIAELATDIERAAKTADMPDVAALIENRMVKVEDQRSQDAAQVQQWMDSVDERFSSLPVPKDGKDADPEATAALVRDEVEKAVVSIPVPQDGKSVTVDDVQPLIAERVSLAVAEAVKAMPVPKDGVGVAGAIVDRGGNLVLTLSNGEVKELGRVEGRDHDPDAMQKAIDDAVAALPKAKDGFGFDDMDMVVAEDGVALVFARGEDKKAFALPVVFDRGVYKETLVYRKGNGVTWGGQFWIAQKDAPEGKPDASSDWRLAVKKGRDVRPAKMGA